MSAPQALTSVALRKDPRGRRQLGRDPVLATVRGGQPVRPHDRTGASVQLGSRDAVRRGERESRGARGRSAGVWGRGLPPGRASAPKG